MHAFIFLVSSNLIQICYSYYGNQKTLNNEIGGVLETYLKPISKLSELFPNQQVEVQLEIDGSNYRGSGPKRYNLRQNPRQNDSAARVETTTIPTTAATKSVVKTMNAEVATNSDTDRPVYMSDLKKVLDDYEKKHSSLYFTEHQENFRLAPPVNIKQNVGTLNEILKILKKGVHVEPDVGKPTEEGMSWFQIKIPRT
ncbi:uncharacterized protein LOC123697933 isoform X2 [Colias croceus]|uniref:uncharacterized protein LOC123697933 isoform X2 n=1 Tax=Colias crocea TaxID=72248 RepID=UPI001E27EDDC|nr:uncharacterized protein LOC123697933 isoform X2 [Colias croceus]